MEGDESDFARILAGLAAATVLAVVAAVYVGFRTAAVLLARRCG